MSSHQAEADALARRLRAANAAGGKSASRKLGAALRRIGGRATRKQGSWRNAKRTAQLIMKAHRGGKAGDVYAEKKGRLLYTNMLGQTAKQREAEWEIDQKRHPNVRTLFGHMTLSRPIGGEMSDQMWRDAARVQLREMGAIGVSYAVLLHDDTKNQHVHIVWSRALPNGKLVSDSNSYYRWRAATRIVESEIGLTQVPFQQSSELSAQSDSMVNAQRRAWRKGTLPSLIDPEIVKRAMANSISFDDARLQIRKAGIDTMLTHKPDGAVKGLLLKRIESEEWLAGSSIDRDLSYPKIITQIEKNRQIIYNQIQIQEQLRAQQQRESQHHQNKYNRERGD